MFTEAILASQCSLFPESSFASPYRIYLFFSYRTTGQDLFYCLKKAKWPSSSSMCQLPFLSLLWCSVQPDQCNVGATHSSHSPGTGGGVGLRKWVCWRTKASGSVFATPPPLVSSEFTFRLPRRRALLLTGRHWHWLWCCCLGNQEAWRPGCRGRSYGRRLGKPQQPSAGLRPAARHAKPPAPQYRSTTNTHKNTQFIGNIVDMF